MSTTLLSGLFATDTGGFWMPRGASTVAHGIDQVFYWILAASVFFFVGIIAAMVLFMVQYRQKSPNQKTHPIAGNIRLEWIWTLIPTVGLMVLFALGFWRWVDLAVPPGDAMEIRVNAKRWVWNFDYPRHKISNTSELIVPQDRNIKLVMISADVLHSFYVPEFRVKRDVLPNRYTSVWFKVPSGMLSRLKDMPAKERDSLQLGNVVVTMGLAQNGSQANNLISQGLILINDKVEKNAARSLVLNDRITVNLDASLKTKLMNQRRDFDGKIKEALNKNQADLAKKLEKERDDAFNKAAPPWLLAVLDSMETAKKKSSKLPEWLYADRDGLDGMWGFVSDTFNVFCTEYCGKEHSRMITRVRVVSDDLFRFWLQRSLSKSPEGGQLFERYGCNSCHSLDGSKNTGPTFLGLYGRKERVTDKKDNNMKEIHLIDTDKQKTFSEYVRESVLKPQAKIVAGFENQLMPTFQGQIPDDHLNILIDFLKFYKPKPKSGK